MEMEIICDIIKQKASENICIDFTSQDKFIPCIRNNVTYIVSGLIFNEKDEILLISEAKKSCYGKWYLPAGRVEKFETLVDGLKREVLEESGFHCSTLYISSVDISEKWFRFNFLCLITGGELKTRDKADNESLEANWFSLNDINNSKINLRHTDIIPVINLAFENKKKLIAKLFINPILKPHTNFVTRLLFILIKQDGQIYIVMSLKDKLPIHLPTSDIPDTSLAVGTISKELFGKQINVKDCSLLNIEHDSRKGDDGILFTFFYFIQNLELPTLLDLNFAWIELKNDDEKNFFLKLTQNHLAIQCNLI